MPSEQAMTEASGRPDPHDEKLVQESVEWLRPRLPGRSEEELRSIVEDELAQVRARAYLHQLVAEEPIDER
jgi:hypothetical protein